MLGPERTGSKSKLFTTPVGLAGKGYREPLAQNPGSGGTGCFCSSTGTVFEKAKEDCGEWHSGMTAYGHEPLPLFWGSGFYIELVPDAKGVQGKHFSFYEFMSEVLQPSRYPTLRMGVLRKAPSSGIREWPRALSLLL